MSTLAAVVFLILGIVEMLIPAIILYHERERDILGYVAGGIPMAVGLLVTCLAWQHLVG